MDALIDLSSPRPAPRRVRAGSTAPGCTRTVRHRLLRDGLVVTPFLPGDSLLFAAGALAASGILNGWACRRAAGAAAILGDNTNYAIGRYVGPRVFYVEDRQGFWHRLLNRQHLDRAHAFFERYGGAPCSSAISRRSSGHSCRLSAAPAP